MATATRTTRTAKTTGYLEAVGRRKTAIARVRISQAPKNSLAINGKDVAKYFGPVELQEVAISPLQREGYATTFAVTAHVSGGGVHAQAEAIRHALSRAVVKHTAEEKGSLRKLGYLKRDSRKKERKHFGLKKARKASQWSKR